VALFDMLIAILQIEEKHFKRFLTGIKLTWNMIFSQFEGKLSEGSLAGDYLYN
jgi:hypothetical protein